MKSSANIVQMELENNELVSDDLVNTAAYLAARSHWRAYFDDPRDQRLGDEDSWDRQVTTALGELGISQAQAAEINQFAKFESQFDNLTDEL